MKMIVFGAVAFIVGLGATTGVVVMRAPAPKVAADSTRVETTAAAAEAPTHTVETVANATQDDSAHSATPRTETAAPVAGDEHAAAPETGGHTGASDAPADPREEEYKQVGRILINMKPADSAKILAHLSDAQLEGIIRTMGVRQAATMLGQLPAERAAAMSRRLLVPAKGGKP